MSELAGIPSKQSEKKGKESTSGSKKKIRCFCCLNTIRCWWRGCPIYRVSRSLTLLTHTYTHTHWIQHKTLSVANTYTHTHSLSLPSLSLGETERNPLNYSQDNDTVWTKQHSRSRLPARDTSTFPPSSSSSFSLLHQLKHLSSVRLED